MGIKRSRFHGALVALAVMAPVSASFAGDGVEALKVEALKVDSLKKECAQCHAFAPPGTSTLEELRSRKGPDLYYAGNKYKRQWLEEWLQKPERLRPAGMFYGNHVKRGEKQDEIDESGLIAHPVLDAAKARSAAASLMTLKGKSELIKAGEYQSGTIPMSMGEMLFDKFRGCLACHEIESGYGGVSGPELYTAGKRLQEDFMVSFMRNPQAWEPRSFMPNRHLSDTDLQKLVHYLNALAKEEKQ